MSHPLVVVALVAAADTYRRELGAVTPITLLTADHTRMLELIHPHLADPELVAAWAAGERMTLVQKVEYALAE